MNPEFWHSKWEKNEIGFHLKSVHPLLKKFLPQVSVKPNAKVFVPLCGKTLDIGYLLQQGFDVVANELNNLAVEQLFTDLGLTPEISKWQGGQCYRHVNLTIWTGDYFSLSQEQLGKVDWVYDRAALIALPESMREQYALQMQNITCNAPQLLIALDYDQSVMAGPPFSVAEQEITRHYQDNYKIELLSRKDIIEHEAKFASRGLSSMFESVYALTAK